MNDVVIPIKTTRKKILIILRERHARDSLVMAHKCPHQAAAFEHIPDLDRLAATRDNHVGRRIEEDVLDRLAMIHAHHDR